jgi:hypothetical protein
LDDSGTMIALQDGAPEATAEFVIWLLQRFPPADEVTVQLLGWAPTQVSPLHRPGPARQQT